MRNSLFSSLFRFSDCYQTGLRLQLFIPFNMAQQLLIKFTRTKGRYI